MADHNPPGTNGLDPHAGPSDRLNSWKEIATYLGKGVRTVQRWESQMGLPVRRFGREGGEIVYALKSEIDAWILSGGRHPESDPLKNSQTLSVIGEEDPPPESTSAPALIGHPPPQGGAFLPRWLWALPAAIVVFGLAMSASERLRPGQGPSVRNPVGAVCELGALRAWDSDGKTLWRVPLGSPCDPRLDTRMAVDTARVQSRIAVQDLDGDGSAEVLIVARSVSGSGDNLRVLNSDGSSRFTHVPGRPVTYGKEAFRGFNAYSIHLINENDGRVSLWLAASHVPWFPTILQQLSPSGEVMSEYWNNGHIVTLRPVTLRGRPFLLVGGYNNESRGGSLALLDRTRANATAPAENQKYRCKDCAEGEPEEFLVFPNADITNEASAGEGSASVTDAILTGQDLVVTVHQASARVPGDAETLTASINYTLSADDLTLRRVEVSGSYRSIHKSFERVGRLDHPIGVAEEKALSSVVRWNGARFVPLGPPPLNAPRIVRDAKPLPARDGL